MVIFHTYVNVYQRVCPFRSQYTSTIYPLYIHYTSTINHYFPEGILAIVTKTDGSGSSPSRRGIHCTSPEMPAHWEMWWVSRNETGILSSGYVVTGNDENIVMIVMIRSWWELSAIEIQWLWGSHEKELGLGVYHTPDVFPIHLFNGEPARTTNGVFQPSESFACLSMIATGMRF